MGFLGSKPTGTILQLRSARASSSMTFGDLRWNSTVRLSTFFVPPTTTPESVAAPTLGSFGSTMRSMEYTTSSAVTGLPSCHNSPLRSLTFHTEPSALASMLSANRFFTCMSKSHQVRPSYMMYWMAMSGSYEPVCGSAVSLAEPPTMPTMRLPPLLGVPAAEAELDADVPPLLPHAAAIGPSATAAPAIAAPFRTSRRVRRCEFMNPSIPERSNPDLPSCSFTILSPILVIAFAAHPTPEAHPG